MREWLGRALLVLAASVFTLGVVELGFRLHARLAPSVPKHALGKGEALLPSHSRLPGVRLQFRPGAHFQHVYPSDPRGYFRPGRRVDYHMNNLGFRGADVAPMKPPGVRRLALVGDSFTFGAGVHVEDRFVTLLPERLAERGEPDVEVFDFAVGGWDTAQEIAYLEQAGLDLAPDLVVVVYVLNDADDAGAIDLWTGFVSHQERGPFAWSHLARWLRGRLGRRELGRRYVEQLVEVSSGVDHLWQQSFADLARGRDLTKARGARFAVAIFPFLYLLDERYPFRPVHERVLAACRAEGIEVLDLFGAFEGQDYEDLWVHASDQHPNERGHAIAADALADWIVERRLLAR